MKKVEFDCGRTVDKFQQSRQENGADEENQVNLWKPMDKAVTIDELMRHYSEFCSPRTISDFCGHVSSGRLCYHFGRRGTGSSTRFNSDRRELQVQLK